MIKPMIAFVAFLWFVEITDRLLFGSSLDQIGPIAQTVGDAALILGAMSGLDPRDATSSPEAVPDYAASLNGSASAASLDGVRIGVPRALLGDGLDPAVHAAIYAALDLLKAKSITWWRRLPKNHALGIACHENSRLLLSRPAIIGFEQYRPRSSKNACDSPDSGK